MVLTLTLGIGATTSMFSVVDGVPLQPLPYRDPGRLVTLYTMFPQWRGQPILDALWNTLRTPYPDYRHLVEGQRSLPTSPAFRSRTDRSGSAMKRRSSASEARRRTSYRSSACHGRSDAGSSLVRTVLGRSASPCFI